MKSLSENYSASHSNTHETFADLVFCALVVLILFVLALTVEVSQRVRGVLPQVEQVKEVVAADVATLSPEEIEELSKKLQVQQAELDKLRSQMSANEQLVQTQLSSMAGEQRFTGAREPAAFSIAFNYVSNEYYFVPAKDINDADRQRSGETLAEYRERKMETLVKVALAARKQRGYSLPEIQSLLGAVSMYQMVIPTATGYRVEQDKAGIYYHVLLCGFISGDTEISELNSLLVERAINSLDRRGPASDGMYPSCKITVDPTAKRLNLGGIGLSPTDLREILLSLDGRGLLLDFEGYSGKVPEWLYEQVLAPAGYTSKTPKGP